MAERTDRRFLTDVAYADEVGLMDRVALYEFQRPRIDLVAEVVAVLGDLRGRRVVDVGCGNGRYLPAMVAGGASVVGLDLSIGMLRSIAPSRVVGDAARLPLPDRSVDVALLLHMLYHVPVPARAISEAHRVLRSDGTAVVMTAGDHHLEAMNAVWLGVLNELDIRGDHEDLSLVNRRFPARDASALLGTRFSDVVERTLRAEVAVSDPRPVLRHAASTSAAHTARQRHAGVLERMRDRVASIIAREGEFRTTTETAMLVAR